jgi:hypothetical protein
MTRPVVDDGVPPRTVTEEYLSKSHRWLDVKCDVDLGELLPNHHVILRGIERGRTFNPPTAGPIRVEEADRLHYEHVPGLAADSPTPDWGFSVSDDHGTEYLADDSGAYDGHSGGAATHGFRNLGSIPPEASRLIIEIHPATDWVPSEPWQRKLIIDLLQGIATD